MLKLFKNLKESTSIILIIIILLVIQAMADLELPDYTSKIVNVGIQQSGIENPAPEAITEEKMDNVLMFAENDEKILSNYKLIKSGSNTEYLQKYPILETENLYILNKINKSEQEELNTLMAKPIMFYTMLTSEEYSSMIKDEMLAEIPEAQKDSMINFSLLDIVKSMNTEQRAKMIEKIDENLNELPGSILNQAAISSNKSEYEKIGIDMSKYQNRYVAIVGIQMLGVALLSMAAAIIIIMLSSRVAAKLGKNLRSKIFEKVLSFSSKEFREFSTASLITRSTNDIQQIQQLIVMMFRVLVYAPIIGFGGFFKVLTSSDDSMAWIIGFALLAIFVVCGSLFMLAVPKFKKFQILIDKVNGVSREILTGIPVIRAFNREKYEESRFDKENIELTKVNMFIGNVMSLMMPGMLFIMNSVPLLIIWVGGHKVDEGLIQVGDMMAFIQYSFQIIISFLMISMLSISLPRAGVSAGRINEVLDKENNILDPKEPKKFNKNKKGVVEFKNVSFKYPDAKENILENINFVAEAGKTTAIIGSTGSGKSTVVNLIPRFYDVTEGELFVDGVNVKDVNQKDLRDIIGYIPQKGVLFSGTIESNIKYSDENMSDKKMIKAAQIAQAEEFISAKEDKYKSDIAQGGNNVSGGQRQRLSIARAIAKDPEIFIFDDSFSALDFKTDSNLREALKEQTDGKTVIIIAQRVNTILEADQIIVLEEGKVVGKGTHKDLMKNNEVYRQIALSQLSEEELSK